MIGVSFTGHDGRRSEFSVQGAEDAAKRMSGISEGSSRETAGDAMRLFQSVRRQKAKQPAFPQEQQNEKVMPGGSVVRGMDGALCLRGEEGNPLVPGTKMYAAKDGDKGFFSFDEIDPPVRGAVVGRDVGDESQSYDANDAVRDRPDGTSWAMRYLTEEKWKKDDVTGLITVYKYFRLVYYSALGRAIGCSKEWREVLFAFLPGSGGGGQWEVRPVKNSNDQVTEFLFGAASDLGTESDNVDDIREKDAVTSVKVLTCPGGA